MCCPDSFLSFVPAFAGISSNRLRPPAPRSSGAPHVAFTIQFHGEAALGQAGPYRAFFADICRELQTHRGGEDEYPLALFVPTPNSRNGVGEGREKYYPNPVRRHLFFVVLSEQFSHSLCMYV